MVIRNNSYFLLVLFILFADYQIFACTSFCVVKNSEIYLAKNLDWPIDLGYVFLNEKGIRKSILNTFHFSQKEFTWYSKYRSISFNQFGKEFPLGGMNEEGLVVEELNMPNVTLNTDSLKYPINEFQLV